MSAINPLPSSGTSSDKRSYEPSMEEILASIRRIIADDQGLPTRGGPIGDPASTVESSHELLRMPSPYRPATPAPADPVPAPQPAVAPEPSEPAVSAHQPPLAPAVDEPASAAPHGVAAHGPIAAPQYPTPDGHIGGADATPIARALATPDPIPPAADPYDESPEVPPARHARSPASAPLEKEDEMFDAPIEPKPADPTPLFSATTDAAVSSAFNMLAASRLADNSEELMTIAKEMIRPMLRAWLDDNLPSMVERMVRAEIERVARGGR